MGRYINQNSKGESLPANGKAKALIADGAKVIPQPTEFEEDIVCVVENGMFDAAGYMFNVNELKAFTYPGDYRPKTWLKYEHADKLAV